ncbi:MAG: site-2 protease family protein [Proteobacteria bacterium]|nr:site-2 protease family protein [Pseudomonadota bacterium]NIS71676.1 site-2 protease family protein [Pseudomonadota bacterium]
MEWILWLPILLFSVVMHECAHGYVASLCGDDTARYAGRITLNPVPHLDPFGSILMPLLLILTGSNFFIAWAKPVPVNPRNFRNPGRDDIMVSLAGPATNLMLALFFTLLAIIGQVVFRSLPFLAYLAQTLTILSVVGMRINLLLAIFNLIPIPPLDGSHILRELLPYRAAIEFDRISRYGFIILLVLVMTPLFRFIFLPADILFLLLRQVIQTVG